MVRYFVLLLSTLLLGCAPLKLKPRSEASSLPASLELRFKNDTIRLGSMATAMLSLTNKSDSVLVVGPGTCLRLRQTYENGFVFFDDINSLTCDYFPYKEMVVIEPGKTYEVEVEVSTSGGVFLAGENTVETYLGVVQYLKRRKEISWLDVIAIGRATTVSGKPMIGW